MHEQRVARSAAFDQSGSTQAACQVAAHLTRSMLASTMPSSTLMMMVPCR